MIPSGNVLNTITAQRRLYEFAITKILSGYFFAETRTPGGYPTSVYSTLLNIATNLELRKATHATKLELLEATLVTLESYKRRCTVVVYDSIRLTRDCDPQRTDRGMIDSSIGWSMCPFTGLRVLFESIRIESVLCHRRGVVMRCICVRARSCRTGAPAPPQQACSGLCIEPG